jgi:hypothetical protein
LHRWKNYIRAEILHENSCIASDGHSSVSENHFISHFLGFQRWPRRVRHYATYPAISATHKLSFLNSQTTHFTTAIRIMSLQTRSPRSHVQHHSHILKVRQPRSGGPSLEEYWPFYMGHVISSVKPFQSYSWNQQKNRQGSTVLQCHLS